MVSVYKAAGQPLPQFSSDDVLNFKITEAAMAAYGEFQEAEIKRGEKETERARFKRAVKTDPSVLKGGN